MKKNDESLQINAHSALSLRPIGIVSSCFKKKFGTPRQSGLVRNAVGELIIFPEYQPEISLQGLEEISHLWVMFWFHQNGDYHFHAKIHPPRLKGESMGVFATRSPHRPNPIGLSLVKILKVLTNSILVSGLDLIEGTPILDIKPYLAGADQAPNATGGWVTENPEEVIRVEFTESATMELKNWMTVSTQISKYDLNLEQLYSLITEMIQMDPRPLVYRGSEGVDSKYRSEHAFYLFDGDIHFKFMAKNHAMVEEIRLLQNP